MVVAVRIARAKSGKDKILFCGYHGWHDWYLAANLGDNSALDGHLLPGLSPKGVARELKGSSLTFQYNDIEGFMKIVEENKESIGVIVMEPIRNNPPQKGFLEKIREVSAKLGIVLIFDEITAGFRLNAGGSHLTLGVNPDMAVFAKAISNGYPMAAIIGTKVVMEAAQDSFISSTYWTEKIGPVAALATIKKFKKLKVHAHLKKSGEEVQKGWAALAKKNGLNIQVSGITPLGHFDFKYDNPLVLKTLFTQLMLERGFLASNAFYASLAHKDRHIADYLSAVDQSFALIKSAIDSGHPEKYLKGPVCHSGFKRLN